MTDKATRITWGIVACIAAAGLVALAVCCVLNGTGPAWALAGTIAAALAAVLTGALKKMGMLKTLAFAVAAPLTMGAALTFGGCKPQTPVVDPVCLVNAAVQCGTAVYGCFTPPPPPPVNGGNP